MKPELRFLSFELTNVCNAKCHTYCPNSFLTRPRGFMSDEVFEKIIRECKEINTVVAIAPQLLGEPTLDNKLLDRLLYIKKEVPNVRRTLITNGSRLTKEIVEASDVVDISFNYAIKEDYEREMGLDFDATIKRIYSLHEFKDKIIIHYVFSKTTIGHFMMLKNIFKDFKVDLNPWFGDLLGRVPNLNVLPATKRIPCAMVHFQLSIYWNGDAVPCCNDWDGVTSHMIGNVKDKTLVELFNSDYLNRLRGLSDYRGSFCEVCNYNVEQPDQSKWYLQEKI